MKPTSDLLWALAAHFALLSLLAIGGGISVVPEMHRQAVEVARWMSERQFADLYAIAQVSPGPNIIIVTALGYQVAGLAGATVATLAMCAPTCVFTYVAGRAWERFKDARWRIAIQAGLVPLTIGLVAATAAIVVRSADHNWVAVAITAVTAAITYWTRINPLWLFGVAALLGLARLV